MRRRSPARWLAPVALVTCAVAIYAVVDHELGSDAKSGTSTSTKSDTGTTTAKRKATKKAKTTYTVKTGDSLSVIAARTGVDVAALQEANPDIDAAALHPGQKLKLPR